MLPWVALACVEAPTLLQRADGEVCGVAGGEAEPGDPRVDSAGLGLSAAARAVLRLAASEGFSLHHRQPRVHCLPGADRERGVRLLLFTRTQARTTAASARSAPADLLPPAFAAVAARLPPLARAVRALPGRLSGLSVP